VRFETLVGSRYHIQGGVNKLTAHGLPGGSQALTEMRAAF